MENKPIKSALELAAEKLAGLTEMTPEELKQQKAREYQPRGKAIADRYLQRALRETDLAAELGKYQGTEGEIVRAAFLATLYQSINPEDMEKNRRALAGIQRIAAINLEAVNRELEKITAEFNRQRQQQYASYEKLERERLLEAGISGSAVRPDLKNIEGWQQELDEIHRAFDSKIARLKEKLQHDIEKQAQG